MGNYFTIQTKAEYEQQYAPEANRNSFFGGSKGLGDPDSTHMSRKEVLMALPAKRKEIILEEYCPQIYKAFLECRNEKGILSKFRCRDQIVARKQCIKHFWNTPGLEKRTYIQYLAERAQYRRTGKSQQIPTFLEKQFTLDLKPWEQYQEDLKKNNWTLIKEHYYELRDKFVRKKPDISIQVDTESRLDS